MGEILSEEEIQILKEAEKVLTKILVRLEMKSLDKMIGGKGNVYPPGKIEMLASALYEIEKAREEKQVES